MSNSIVLGLGGTVDYEVEWDPDVVEQLAKLWHIGLADLDSTTPITSERSLLISILTFIRDDEGGERYVEDLEVLESFSNRFAKRVTLGGTCVRAGMILSLAGVPSLVHLVSEDETVRRLLPKEMSYLSSATEDSLDPHLIVQYPGETDLMLGDGKRISAKNPNRLIFAHDIANRDLILHHDLAARVRNAKVFLVSGFNVMRDIDALEDRLATIRLAAEGVSPAGLVLFEDAGYHLPEARRRATDVMSKVANVWSMNEDELRQHLGRPVDLLNPNDVVAAAGELRGQHGFNNLMVHTRNWALVFGPRASEFRTALKTANKVASGRFMYGDDLTMELLDTIRSEYQNPQIVDFCRQIEGLEKNLVCEPAYDIEVANPTTIGLGDAYIGGFILGFVSTPDFHSEQQVQKLERDD